MSAVPGAGNPASADIDTNLTSGVASTESCHVPFCSPDAEPERDTGPLADRSQSRQATEAVVFPELAVGYSPEQVAAWEDRRVRTLKYIQRGFDYSHQLAVGSVESVSALAAKEGLSRRRISWLVRLTQLAPEILQDLSNATRIGPVPTAKQLLNILRSKSHKGQLVRYTTFIQEESIPARSGGLKTKLRTHLSGFQHIFERARLYRDMCQSGRYGSLRAVGKVEGVTGDYIGQHLALLALAPDIVARLDVPVAQRPPAIAWTDLLKVARIRDQEEQRRTFERILKESRPGGDEMEQLKS